MRNLVMWIEALVLAAFVLGQLVGCSGGGGTKPYADTLPQAEVAASVPSSVVLTPPDILVPIVQIGLECGPAVASMLTRLPLGVTINELDPQRDGTTPDELAGYLGGHGFATAVVRTTNPTWAVKSALASGRYVIPLVKTGGPTGENSSLHWNLIYGYDDYWGSFYVADSIKREGINFFTVSYNDLPLWFPNDVVFITAQP